MSNYPAHEKLAAAKERHEAVVEFLQWLEGRLTQFGLVALCHEQAQQFGDDEYEPLSDLMLSKLLGEWLGVSYEALQDEKEQMLDELRKASHG